MSWRSMPYLKLPSNRDIRERNRMHVETAGRSANGDMMFWPDCPGQSDDAYLMIQHDTPDRAWTRRKQNLLPGLPRPIGAHYQERCDRKNLCRDLLFRPASAKSGAPQSPHAPPHTDSTISTYGKGDIYRLPVLPTLEKSFSKQSGLSISVLHPHSVFIISNICLQHGQDSQVELSPSF